MKKDTLSFGILELLIPGISESLKQLIDDSLEHRETKPVCQHGNPFCDNDWLPLAPTCGCAPTDPQIFVMTHHALNKGR